MSRFAGAQYRPQLRISSSNVVIWLVGPLSWQGLGRVHFVSHHPRILNEVSLRLGS